MGVLKFIIKVLLFPFAVLIVLISGIIQIVAAIAGLITGLFSGILAFMSIYFMIDTDVKLGAMLLLMTYLISPYGLPMFVSFLADKLTIVSEKIFEL